MSATHADLWTQEWYLTLCFRVRDSSTPHLEDFATVVNLQNGKVTGGIVADESAPELPMGEGSIALAVALRSTPIPAPGGLRKVLATSSIPSRATVNREPRMRLVPLHRPIFSDGEACKCSVAASMTDIADVSTIIARTRLTVS